MNNLNYEEIIPKEELKKGSHKRIMTDFLIDKKNPKILELGVERGFSTKAFVWFVEKVEGKVFSVDIEDCSKVVNSKNWKFIQSNDLNIDYILQHFKEVAEEGVDLIYIDSYHENFHVMKLLNLWFKYLKKDGAIFIDDIDSFPFRKKKDIWNSIVYDLTHEAIEEFYYNNTDKVIYTKYYGENGLARIKKLTNLYDDPNPIKKIWKYNFFVKLVYPYLRKIKKIFK